MNQNLILEAEGLYHVYESSALDGNVVALRGLHVKVRPGEAVAVCLLYTSPSPRDPM